MKRLALLTLLFLLGCSDTRTVECSRCHGYGVHAVQASTSDWNRAVDCERCGGSGWITSVIDNSPGSKKKPRPWW